MEFRRSWTGHRIQSSRSGSADVDPFTGGGGIPVRRGRPRPAPGESLTVKNPQIEEVLCGDTGQSFSVESVIGTDYAEVVKLRLHIRTRLHKDDPAYRCTICNVPVYLCCAPDEKKFFFKHRHEDGNCPAVTRGALSQEEINARKYNGAKESALHRQMKTWLATCLALDGRFNDIASEQRWPGAFSGEWRRPDVRATYNGIPIAFEIQLSTTYLDVIAERRQFYLEQGGLLFWVFAVFDSEKSRMLEDDVFYNNNQNAFVLNAHTVEESLKVNEFRLECIWAEPTKEGGTSAMHRKVVAFHELTLDTASQQAYYFDFDGRRSTLRQERSGECENLRQDFENWFGVQGFYSETRVADWDSFRGRFARQGLEVPRYSNQMDRGLLSALYSAKHGVPWGQDHKKLVEVAHRVATAQKRHMVWFMHAAKEYKRLDTLEEQGSRKWHQKHQACRDEYRKHPESFEPSREQQELVEFLFPELLPLP